MNYLKIGENETIKTINQAINHYHNSLKIKMIGMMITIITIKIKNLLFFYHLVYILKYSIYQIMFF